MDSKTIQGAIVGAIVVGLATWLLGGFTDRVDKGSEALTEEQIRAVLRETQKTTINGETMTYGEALSRISTTQILLQKDVETLTEAVGALTQD